MQDIKIKNPTIRKIHNRDLKVVVFKSPEGVRNGWLIEEAAKFTRIHLVGDDRATVVRGDDRKYLTIED